MSQTHLRCLSDKWLPLGRTESSFTDRLSGFGVQASSSHGFHLPCGGQTAPASLVKRQALDKENDLSLLGKQWSLASSGLSLNLMDSGLKGADTLYQMRGTSRSDSFNEYPSFPGHRIDNQQVNWLMPQSMLPYNQMSTHSGEMMPRPMASLKPEAMKPKEGNCKLFGIPLVHKQGTALGRSVDLAKFNNYEELIAELDHLFDFNGEFKPRNKNCLVVYILMMRVT
ncbi:hypothetical protein RND71_021654 [Anisodus tanguticus]|uniref:Auxin-responsive protein n=1 Tax=Anisodus tanguticus TaxID=243964 RepID=A0AAE1VGB6_9SOLA|nr:hypothetical protein RND71_021654 [Anisodus tanguticus]